MKRKRLVGIVLVIICILFAGCTNQKMQEKALSEKEIQDIIGQVVGGEEALQEAGMGYFSALNAENRNLMNASSLHELISKDPDGVYILDIRRKEDFDKGHIKGANHCWWFDVGKNIDMLPTDKQIVVCCYTGQSAGQVIGVLQMMGYDAIALLGGMNNGWYAENNLPIEK